MNESLQFNLLSINMDVSNYFSMKKIAFWTSYQKFRNMAWSLYMRWFLIYIGVIGVVVGTIFEHGPTCNNKWLFNDMVGDAMGAPHHIYVESHDAYFGCSWDSNIPFEKLMYLVGASIFKLCTKRSWYSCLVKLIRSHCRSRLSDHLVMLSAEVNIPSLEVWD